MIIRWIIIGSLILNVAPVSGQDRLQTANQQDSLLTVLDSLQGDLERAQRLRHPQDIAIAHLKIGRTLRELGQNREAIQSTRQGLALARQAGFKQLEALSRKDLSETYEELQKTDSALVHLKHYLILLDSLHHAALNSNSRMVATENTQNQMSTQREVIDSLRQERKLNQLSNYFIISVLILALALSTLLVIRYRMKRKLAESKLLNQKLEAKEIRRELEGKQKDLTNLALEIARKNELFTQTNQAIAEIDLDSLQPEQRQKIQQLIQFNTNQLRINEDLEELLINIEQVNADFFEKLQQIAPDLTPYERQLCALFRLNLSNKDIASIRNISPKSVEMARYRLRKKLPLEAGDDIYAFIQNI